MSLYQILRYFCSLIFSGFAGCSQLPRAYPKVTGPVVVGHVADATLNELSGIAPSRRESDMLWTHNDSGGAAEIYALNSTGETLATIKVSNATARDWEDIATFVWHGEPWILIADTGDNNAVRHDTKLYLLPEPTLHRGATPTNLTLNAAFVLPFSWPEGPRDCEGVAVSPETNEILLISKRTEPPVLYSLPLPDLTAPVTGATQVARLLNPVAGVVPPTAAERAIPGRLGQYRSQVSAFDLAPNGSAAAILTYGNIWFYRRAPNESWATALSHAPERIPVQGLPQAEALCFSADSQELWITTEAERAPIQHYRLKP